jgi:hypothetical protein
MSHVMKISPLRNAEAAPISKTAGQVSGKRLIRRKSASAPRIARTNSQQPEKKRM